MRRLLIWWRARRAYRRSLCRWCDQPMFGLVERTPLGSRVHSACLDDYDQDEYERSLW